MEFKGLRKGSETQSLLSMHYKVIYLNLASLTYISKPFSIPLETAQFQ